MLKKHSVAKKVFKKLECDIRLREYADAFDQLKEHQDDSKLKQYAQFFMEEYKNVELKVPQIDNVSSTNLPKHLQTILNLKKKFVEDEVRIASDDSYVDKTI